MLMNETLPSVTAHPFAENIVKDPRRVEPPITGLNDRPLRRLIDEFGTLETSHIPPRREQLSHALLITSAEPGYGKSHLIGRFLRTLDRRASKIYIKPFQNPSLCWQSILLRTIQELNFPDRSEVEFGQPGEPTQLDTLAIGIFAHLIAASIEGGEIAHDEPERASAYLRLDPVEAFGFADETNSWAEWMRRNFEQLLPTFEQQLDRHGLGLTNSPSSWLRVLFRYSFWPGDFTLRRTCLSWLKGESIESDEGDEIGLRARDLPKAEMQPVEVNDLCKMRIFDLCALSGFYRPLVFCFDQTEIYGHRSELARCFGMVVSELVRQSINQMTVVTANLDPWLKAIVTYMEKADQDCFRSPYIALEGLNRTQGEELVKSRLHVCEMGDPWASTFLDPQWLRQTFPHEHSRLGARHFLQLCQKRWVFLPNGNTPGESSDEPVRRSLEDYYKGYKEELQNKSKRLLFDPDTLLWLVQEPAKTIPGLVIEPYRGENIVLSWLTGTRRTLFGFESGAHWKRWQVITREAARCFDADGARTVFFRTAELSPIPGRWRIAEEIERAKETYLHILVLAKEEIAELYAARELFAEAVQGNVPFSGDEVLTFLGLQLKPWWERLKS